MTRLDDILRTAFSELAEEDYGPSDHPALEELARFADDDLEPVRREQIRKHLLGCRHCLEVAVPAVSFPDIDPPSDELRITSEDVETRWATFQHRLVQDREVARRARKPRMKPALLAAVAASFAVVVVGALILRERLDLGNRSSSITVNTSIYSLVPDTAANATSRSSPKEAPVSDGVQVIEISPGSQAILLILNVESFQDAPGYEAELFRNGEKEPIWTSTTIRRTRQLNFNVTFSRSILEPGFYTLDLSSVSPEGRARIARYRLEIVSPK